MSPLSFHAVTGVSPLTLLPPLLVLSLLSPPPSTTSYISFATYELASSRVQFVDILIGIPSQRHAVLFDTGSPILGVACTPCTLPSCRALKNDSYFDYDLSKTHQFIKCSDKRCCPTDPTGRECGVICDTMDGWIKRRRDTFYHSFFNEEGEFDANDSYINNFKIDVLNEEGNLDKIEYDVVGPKKYMQRTSSYEKHQNLRSFNDVQMNDEAVDNTNICGQQISYGGGNAIWGPLIDDFVAFGDTNERNLLQTYPGVLCIFNQEASYQGLGIGGIVGTSYGFNIPKTTVMDSTYNDPTINSSSFGVCASQTGGVIHVGGYDTSLLKPNSDVNLSFIRMVKDAPFYATLSTKFNFGGKQLDQEYEYIWDTGTTYLFVPHEVYIIINDFLDNLCINLEYRIPQSRCLRYTESKGITRQWINVMDLSIFPDMEITMNTNGSSVVYTIPPENYLRRINPQVQIEGIAISQSTLPNIIGSLAMRNKYVYFDIDNKQIGIADADCPIVDLKDRPSMFAIPTGVTPGGSVAVTVGWILIAIATVISICSSVFFVKYWFAGFKKFLPKIKLNLRRTSSSN